MKMLINQVDSKILLKFHPKYYLHTEKTKILKSLILVMIHDMQNGTIHQILQNCVQKCAKL